MRQVNLVADLHCTLGECPRWHAGEGVLYFVDMAERRLHRLDPATGALKTRQLDQTPACFAFREKGGFVLGMDSGFFVLDDMDGPAVPFGRQVEAEKPWSRLNDGRTDPQGRFWAGATDRSKEHSDGLLYRLDPDRTVTPMAGGALTLNGCCFSPDGRTFYWSDTPRYVIYACDFDPERGAIFGHRIFHRFPEGHGRPDGGSVDEEGCYWSALYAGGRVAKLSPKGELLEEVAIPATNITMPCFGGPDRRTVYVTTASENAPADEAEKNPHAGGVFSFRVDVPGLTETPFAG